MSEFTPQKLEIKRKVAIVIPCYKASDSIDLVVNSCLSYLKELDELIAAGLSLSAASKYLAKKNGLKKSEIYNMN